MDIKRAKQEINHTIEAYLLRDDHGEYEIQAFRQRPILLMGPPGIGKTQIMEQIARERGIGLVSYTITHHTRQSAIGLPLISEKAYRGHACQVTGYTMSEIVASVYDRIEQTGLTEGILFIDEINCVSETLAPTMLQFLQYKTFGNHQIPEGWVIVAAGNPAEFNKSVREFDMATLDRVKKIPVEADYGVWKEYAYQAGIHPAIISYLNAKTQHFYRVETTPEGKSFATPRGWEDLSRLIQVYEKLGYPVDRDVVIQYIQQDKIARDFAGYLALYYKYQSDYQVDAILERGHNPQLVRLAGAGTFDEKLSLVGILLSKLGNRFQKAHNMSASLEQLLQQLKEWKSTLVSEHALSDLEQVLTRFDGERIRKKEAGLLSREEHSLALDVRDRLEFYIQVLKEEHTEADDILDRVRQLFDSQAKDYDLMLAEIGAMVERAFDFMEAAFGDSQEMVVFITELNTGIHSIWFMNAYHCERYFYYNKRLLFEEREDEIRNRLSHML